MSATSLLVCFLSVKRVLAKLGKLFFISPQNKKYTLQYIERLFVSQYLVSCIKIILKGLVLFIPDKNLISFML